MKTLKALRLYNTDGQGGNGSSEGTAASTEVKQGVFSGTPDHLQNAESSEATPATQQTEEKKVETQGEGTSGAATTPPATPSAVTMTNEQLAALVRSTRPAAAVPEPKLTPEEFEKRFNVVKVNEDHVNKLLAGEGTPQQRAAVLQELLHGAVRQAVTMSQFQRDTAMQQLQQNLAPIYQTVASQQEQAYRTEFMTKFPEFKGYEPVLELIYKDMKAAGQRFAAPDDAYKAIAERARGIIPVLKQGGGTTTANANGAKPASNSSSRMPTLSGGGQGGAGGTGGQQKQLSKAQSVFA